MVDWKGILKPESKKCPSFSSGCWEAPSFSKQRDSAASASCVFSDTFCIMKLDVILLNFGTEKQKS